MSEIRPKIIYPESKNAINSKEIDLTSNLNEPVEGNVLESLGNGATEGLKLAANIAAMLIAFVALVSLVNYILSIFGGNNGISEKTAVLASYALCGFANFASIGIQLGGIGSIAPERKKDLAKLVTKAMFGGALASWLTATIAGILI